MQKIKRVRHGVLGIALSPAGASRGAMTVAEANDYVNKVLEEGFHAVQINVLRNTFSESGDPAYVQNQYLFIEYEDESEIAPARVGRPRKVEEPVA